MAVKTRDEIMSRLNEVFGENDSDDVLEIMTDISDTLGNQSDAQRISELENQLDEQDKAWRKKYRDAFLNGTDEPDEPEEPRKPRRFEDLFKTE